MTWHFVVPKTGTLWKIDDERVFFVTGIKNDCVHYYHLPTPQYVVYLDIPNFLLTFKPVN